MINQNVTFSKIAFSCVAENKTVVNPSDFGTKCYQFSKNNETPIEFLVDILDGDVKPEKGSGIFLIETSCAKDGLVHLMPRYFSWLLKF